MKRRLLIAALVVLLLMVAAAGCLLGLYAATQVVPDEYWAALEVDPARAAAGSDQMLQKTAALASEVKKEGEWAGVFSADEINGWLAVDLVQNHPDALPDGLSDPRVVIRPEEATLFCRLDHDNFQSVVSLSADVYLAEPNVIGLRLRAARAGLLPLPMREVVEQITKTVHRMNFRIQWRQTEGDPVALITIPPPRDEEGKEVQLTELRLGDGEIYVRGLTRRH